MVQESDDAARQITAIQLAKLNFTIWTVIKSLFNFKECYHFFHHHPRNDEEDARESTIVAVNGQMPKKRSSPRRRGEDVESPLRGNEDHL